MLTLAMYYSGGRKCHITDFFFVNFLDNDADIVHTLAIFGQQILAMIFPDPDIWSSSFLLTGEQQYYTTVYPIFLLRSSLTLMAAHFDFTY